MGLFSGFFTSEKDIKREEDRRKRRALSKAEDAIDTVDLAIADLKKNELVAWNDAKKAAAAGRKAEAMLALQKYRGFEVQINNYEKRKWVFENYIIRLKMSEVNEVLIDAMNAFKDAIQIDVDAFTNSFNDFTEKSIDINGLDKIWEKSFEKNLNGMSLKEMDVIPDVESLFNSLQGEVALEIGGGAKDVAKTKTTMSDIEAKADAVFNMESEE